MGGKVQKRPLVPKWSLLDFWVSESWQVFSGGPHTFHWKKIGYSLSHNLFLPCVYFWPMSITRACVKVDSYPASRGNQIVTASCLHVLHSCSVSRHFFPAKILHNGLLLALFYLSINFSVLSYKSSTHFVRFMWAEDMAIQNHLEKILKSCFNLLSCPSLWRKFLQCKYGSILSS